MDTQAVEGSRNGENDESVLLNDNGISDGRSITQRIEEKVRAGLKVEYFVSIDTRHAGCIRSARERRTRR
jgi:hypothetical protein